MKRYSYFSLPKASVRNFNSSVDGRVPGTIGRTIMQVPEIVGAGVGIGMGAVGIGTAMAGGLLARSPMARRVVGTAGLAGLGYLGYRKFRPGQQSALPPVPEDDIEFELPASIQQRALDAYKNAKGQALGAVEDVRQRASNVYGDIRGRFQSAPEISKAEAYKQRLSGLYKDARGLAAEAYGDAKLAYKDKFGNSP